MNWNTFVKTLADESAIANIIVHHLPAKSEFIRALRDRSYATYTYPNHESINLFVVVAQEYRRIARRHGETDKLAIRFAEYIANRK